MTETERNKILKRKKENKNKILKRMNERKWIEEIKIRKNFNRKKNEWNIKKVKMIM